MKQPLVVIISIIAILVISGCASQSGEVNVDDNVEVNVDDNVEISGKTTNFPTLKEVYDSGLDIKCEGETTSISLKYYLSDQNIRVETHTQYEVKSYQIIRNDNVYHSWTEVSGSVTRVSTISGETVEKQRRIILTTPLVGINCVEQPVSASLFEPPQDA